MLLRTEVLQILLGAGLMILSPNMCTVFPSIGTTLSKDSLETVIVRDVSAGLICVGRVMKAD